MLHGDWAFSFVSRINDSFPPDLAHCWVASLTAAKGHEERFPPRRLRVGCAFRKETIARMRRNGRDAPIPATHGTVTELGGSTPNRPTLPCRWVVGFTG
jgi:hypothetical protein